MKTWIVIGRLALATCMLLLPLASAHSQSSKKKPDANVTSVAQKTHRVVIQITQDDPALMTMALNNAENLTKYFQEKNEPVTIEFVAFGPGLAMVRSDVSPVKDRIKGFRESMKQVTFSGCENTMAAQSKRENKVVTLLSEARTVPSGIARVTELQEQGWSYVRP